MKQKLQQIKEALKPFVKISEIRGAVKREDAILYSYHSGEDDCSYQITVKDILKAKEAFTALDELMEMLDSEELVTRVADIISARLRHENLLDEKTLHSGSSAKIVCIVNTAKAAINAITGK